MERRRVFSVAQFTDCTPFIQVSMVWVHGLQLYPFRPLSSYSVPAKNGKTSYTLSDTKFLSRDFFVIFRMVHDSWQDPC